MNQLLRQEWEAQGFLVIPQVFPVAEIDRIRDHFMEWNSSDRREDFDRVDPTGVDPLAQYPRIIHPHRRDALSLDYLLDPRIQHHLTEFLEAEPYAAQTMFYFKPPSARGQALHQDQAYLRAHPGTCVAAWVAIDDCDDANGCMQVVPGSHVLPLLCHIEADLALSFSGLTVPVPPGYAPISVPMKAGDVLFFHGSLIHGSGPNTTADRFRRSFISHYITADATEAWSFYHPLLRFDGSEADLADAIEGSECGVVTESGIEIVPGALHGPKSEH